MLSCRLCCHDFYRYFHGTQITGNVSMADVGFVTVCHRDWPVDAQNTYPCNKKRGLRHHNVTFRDGRDKTGIHSSPIVGRMKTKAIYLTTTLVLASTSLVFGDSASEQLKLRYGNSNGKAALSVSHDISAGGHDSMASRSFLMDLELDESQDTVSVKVNKAKGSYTAHGMTQRLPASKLTGQSITFSKRENGQLLERADPGNDLDIPVGQVIGADYPIGLALVDILPVLPEGPVSVGTTWTTTRDTRSLEGWAWATGSLSSQHTVTALDKDNGHTIVSVTSTSKAQLVKDGNGLQYSGDGALNRTSNWRFDASDGRLLSVLMEQETSGINTLPQGETEVRQLTKVEFIASG